MSEFHNPIFRLVVSLEAALSGVMTSPPVVDFEIEYWLWLHYFEGLQSTDFQGKNKCAEASYIGIDQLLFCKVLIV